MRRMSNLSFEGQVKTILKKKDIFSIRNEINAVNISESIEKYIVELIFATRNPREYNMEDQAEYIRFGASPRASINMNLGSKAVAFFDGRDYVLPEDVKEVAQDVLNHRILLNYEAEADGVLTHHIIEEILQKVNVNQWWFEAFGQVRLDLT